MDQQTVVIFQVCIEVLQALLYGCSELASVSCVFVVKNLSYTQINTFANFKRTYLSI